MLKFLYMDEVPIIRLSLVSVFFPIISSNSSTFIILADVLLPGYFIIPGEKILFSI